MTAEFLFDKVTKNKVRYKENADPDKEMIGLVYVSKKSIKESCGITGDENLAGTKFIIKCEVIPESQKVVL